jgi:hypothetical protein
MKVTNAIQVENAVFPLFIITKPINDRNYSIVLLNLIPELFLHAFFARILLEPSYSLGLKAFSVTTALYLINPFRLKQFEPFLNVSFNLRIIVLLPSNF